MAERVVVSVPATVANLGPGFDCLGLALGWHDQVRVERAPDGPAVTVAGTGAERIPRDASNLVLRGLAAIMGDAPAVSVHQMTAIPSGRGFGSSAAAIVAGLVAGRALADSSHGDDELVGLAAAIEGHADNVAPCLLGGVAVIGEGRALRLDPPAGLRALVCVAPSGLPTTAARAALPEVVPREEAARSMGRAALLAASLAAGRLDALLAATEDSFHQPARFELMPDSGALVDGLRAGGIAAFLAGAGPSVGALVLAGDVEGAAAAARRLAPEGWDVRIESLDGDGATIVESQD